MVTEIKNHVSFSRMSISSLSSEAQLRYMLQWFEEWSELQRQDFLPLLAEKISRNGVYMNGVVNSMSSVNCDDKPMNLFQCRAKLFNEWYPSWTQEECDRLVRSISEIDETFVTKLHEEISGNKENIVDYPPYENDESEENTIGNVVSVEPDLVREAESALQNAELLEVENQEVLPPMINDITSPLEIQASS